MDFFKKIQKLNPFYKKLIVFIIIFVLAIPFLFFIGKNFQKRLKEFEKEDFLKTLNIEEIKEKKSELGGKLKDELKKMEEIEKSFSTSTTSTE